MALIDTPAVARRRISGAELVPAVSVTGILTTTLSPKPCRSRAWRSISAKSSEMTSNEMGRSVMVATSSLMKDG